jgi:hypothetical protein
MCWSQSRYAKDKSGTLFDKEETKFNLDNLDTRFSRDWIRNAEMRNERIENDSRRKRKAKSGVNTNIGVPEDETEDGEGLIRSYLYLGSFGSSFCGMIYNNLS